MPKLNDDDDEDEDEDDDDDDDDDDDGAGSSASGMPVVSGHSGLKWPGCRHVLQM